jgi:putative tryptophan/tyrosine transport system substrate-binding protein
VILGFEGTMKRREFIAIVGSAAATWPLAARAQQPTMPVIGYLSLGSRESDSYRLTGLRQGLDETGYIEGRNLTVEHRWAENQIDRLPALAAELVQMRVAAIVTPGLVSTLPAKAATNNIPILFVVAADPVRIGLVASLNRPGGNVTGVNALNSELGAKQIALLHELLPNVPTVGFLENPSNQIDELMTTAVLAAAAGIGLRIQTLKAATAREIDAAFESLVQARTAALLVSNDAFLVGQDKQIIALAARLAIPVMSGNREFVVAGGLISYGASVTGVYRQLGLYAGRILKGASPEELPVIQSSKLTLVINLKTAKSLGLTIPDRLLALADEVIE